MQIILLLVFIAIFVNTSWTKTKIYPRGCISWGRLCIRECEEGTHAYAVTNGYLEPERTCDNPEPQINNSEIYYDFSSCYCDFPTVRDTNTNKCVTLDKCTKNLNM